MGRYQLVGTAVVTPEVVILEVADQIKLREDCNKLRESHLLG
ncbi:hypothetical protein [Brevibacillus laterosporus]|nr:hypothetical protein [Brevibacillus laterosporus]